MPGLQFAYAEFFQEIEAIRSLTASFLDPTSLSTWDMVEGSLRGIQQNGGYGVHRWEIPRDRPLLTVNSAGGYEPDSKGRHCIFAEVSSIWEIQPTNEKVKKGV